MYMGPNLSFSINLYTFDQQLISLNVLSRNLHNTDQLIVILDFEVLLESWNNEIQNK